MQGENKSPASWMPYHLEIWSCFWIFIVVFHTFVCLVGNGRRKIYERKYSVNALTIDKWYLEGSWDEMLQKQQWGVGRYTNSLIEQISANYWYIFFQQTYFKSCYQLSSQMEFVSKTNLLQLKCCSNSLTWIWI